MALAIGAVLLAPAAEELAFRHLFFRRLFVTLESRGHLLPVAYIASGLLFAAIHGNPSGLLTYTWLGITFAHAYRLTGRVWVPIAVHAVNNGTTLALLLFAPDAPV